MPGSDELSLFPKDRFSSAPCLSVSFIETPSLSLFLEKNTSKSAFGAVCRQLGNYKSVDGAACFKEEEADREPASLLISI